jgi:excisionase family DNA binding protein
MRNEVAERPEYLTTGEVAELVRLSPNTIRAHADELGALRVGRQLRFPTPIREASDAKTTQAA